MGGGYDFGMCYRSVNNELGSNYEKIPSREFSQKYFLKNYELKFPLKVQQTLSPNKPI